MHTQEIIINNNKTLFKISENHDFKDDTDHVCNYDYVYRLVDITGNLTSEVDKFSADGYGFGTVVKMSATHLAQLDANIKKMVENAVNGESLSNGLLVNKKDNSEGMKLEFVDDGVDFVVLVKVVNGESLSNGLLVNKKDNSEGMKLEFVDDGVDFVVLVKVVDSDAYVLIFDSMPNYNNYHFLFAGIHNFKNGDMHIAEIEKISDKKNNFYFYYGDENTDSNFDDWLSETAPTIHKIFRKLGIAYPFSE